ncbi:MAG TPA: P1 family peptidase [Candidatus Methylomirabilis sp.]|nr:P1 family peptidase [Candidatus Methylomirabilis sp.]
MKTGIRLALGALLGLLSATAFAGDAQEDLAPNTAVNGPALTFDWPEVEIGIGSYEAGPTGLTIFRFPKRALGVVDSRGGAPATVNTDLLRLGYDTATLDAIVFTGGSVYGQETIPAVASGLKDGGVRSGLWNNTAIVAGAVVYDFQGHRLNEYYPDKRLARAALGALRPGVFPLGAQGAGRMVMQGWFIGCGAHSGQGGAFRQIGDLKIAAFAVVNALGSVTDREGRLVRCHQRPDWNATRTAEILSRLPLAPLPPAQPAEPAPPATRNTTISLIVTNRKLGYAALQRLAVQVHTSMARGIQPFSTFDDGDTLFAVSTQEVAAQRPELNDFNTIAAEVMWDAILASVPAEPAFAPPATEVNVAPEILAAYAGTYRFGPNARIRVWADQGHLVVEAASPPFFDLRPRQPVALRPLSERDFYVDGRYRTRLSFARDASGAVTGAVIDPGPWQQTGTRVPEPAP